MFLSQTPPNQCLNKRKSGGFKLASTFPCKQKRAQPCLDNKENQIDKENQFEYPVKTTLFSDQSLLWKFINDKNQLLGKGSFGRVVQTHIRNTTVAVKICPKAACSCSGEDNLISVKHSHVISLRKIIHIQPNKINQDIIDYIVSVGLPKTNFIQFGMQIIIMDYAGKRSLQQILDDKNESIDFQRRISFMLQLSSAISYCHSLNIIHFDIKPGNLMVGDGDVCKLVDFGTSKSLKVSNQNCKCNSNSNSNQAMSQTREIGTVIYSAPETFTGISVTEKVDIYSFGITMWQTMTRLIPFSQKESQSIIYRVIITKINIENENKIDCAFLGCQTKSSPYN